jgi:hypothetical protein
MLCRTGPEQAWSAAASKTGRIAQTWKLASNDGSCLLLIHAGAFLTPLKPAIHQIYFLFNKK